MPEERLQKIIARAGLASRRQAEQWITEGRVRVDGRIVRELGTRVDARQSRIVVNGKPLIGSRNLLYFMLHKPRGCVTTVSDPEGRSTVMQFLKKIPERVYPVGRLDYASEGLLLVTNDGDFANHILAASNGIPKTYRVKVSGKPSAQQLDALREGIALEGRKTLPARIRSLPRPLPRPLSRPSSRPSPSAGAKETENSWYEVVLHEGRQNQLRRMFLRIGHPVRKLKRVRIGALTLGELKPGEFRPLRPAEVRALMDKTASDDAWDAAWDAAAHAKSSAKRNAKPK